jgi:glycosyltransferase involved in cell wall biosynthesis
VVASAPATEFPEVVPDRIQMPPLATCGVIVVAMSKEAAMRIALVTDTSPVTRESTHSADDDPRDHASRVSALASTLAGRGNSVTIYARKDSPALPARVTPERGVTIEHLPAGPAARLSDDKLLGHLAEFSEQLAQRWRARRPDVVHAHFWTSGLTALAATRGLPLPLVQTFRTLGDAERKHCGAADGPAARVKLEAVIGRSVSTVLASSTREQAELTGIGVPRSSIRVVPWGVDTTAFLPDGPVAKRSRRPRLLAVSPLSGRHGLDTVIRAMPYVRGAELVIAGGPPRAQLEDNSEYPGLIRLAEQLQVADRVTITGRVSRARMPALLRSADLLVHVPLYEPFGMVPLEAMACGTPVVAAEGGSDQDAVVDGATGALIPPGRPTLLARRIRELLSSPMLLEGYGIAAADRARARYSWERIGLETLAVYERSRTAGPVSPSRAGARR